MIYRKIIISLALWTGSLGCAGPQTRPAQPAARTVRGVVLDSRGLPVDHAVVLATSPQGMPARTGYTNEHGAYMITGLKPGRYLIKVRRAGLPLGQREFEVFGAGALDLHFSVDAAVVRLSRQVGAETRAALFRGAK